MNRIFDIACNIFNGENLPSAKDFNKVIYDQNGTTIRKVRKSYLEIDDDELEECFGIYTLDHLKRAIKLFEDKGDRQNLVGELEYMSCLYGLVKVLSEIKEDLSEVKGVLNVEDRIFGEIPLAENLDKIFGEIPLANNLAKIIYIENGVEMKKIIDSEILVDDDQLGEHWRISNYDELQRAISFFRKENRQNAADTLLEHAELFASEQTIS